MDHNKLKKIIDIVAFNQWKHNIDKVNTVFTSVVVSFDLRESIKNILDINGCFNCGYKNPNNIDQHNGLYWMANNNNSQLPRYYIWHIGWKKCKSCHQMKYIDNGYKVAKSPNNY